MVFHLDPRDRLRSGGRSCRRTAPLGARRKALVTGVACAPSGAPRPAPPAAYAPARRSIATDCASPILRTARVASSSRSVGRRVAADGAPRPPRRRLSR